MVATSLGADRARGHGFYLGMAGVFVLIAFGGFTPSYWAKLAAGNFHGAPITHIHGALFFFWTLFFFVQTALVANGRTPDHRNWGLAGISLATAMAISVVLASINSMKVGDAIGMGDQARQFAIVPLGALAIFATLFTLAIVNIRRLEVHKRLMLMAMIPLMQAALARVFAVYMAPPGAVGPPPVFAAVPPGLTADLLVVAAIVYDWRSRGRPHKVYLICGAVDVAEQLLCWVLGPTAGWMAFAGWVQSLAG
jgi:hypothetical protein